MFTTTTTTKLFLATALVADAAMAATTTLSGTGEFRVDVKDGTPDFTVVSGNSTAGIVLGGIAEMDATGTLTTNVISSLTGAGLTFSGSSAVTLGSVSATRVTFSGSVNVGPVLSAFTANVEVKAWVFKENGTYNDTDTNTQVTAKANTFKWTVKVDGWKFANPSNKLRITADVKAAAAASTGRLALAQSGSVTSKTEGDFKFTYPTTCVADGASAAVDVDVSSSAKHTMTFTKFDNTLVYDPTVESTASASNGDGSGASSMASSIFSVAAAALAAVALAAL